MEFMQKIIQTRSAELAAGATLQHDVLSRMITSSASEGELSMNESELVSLAARVASYG